MKQIFVLAVLFIAVGLGVWWYRAQRRPSVSDGFSPEALVVAPDKISKGMVRGTLQILADIFPQIPELQSLTRMEARLVLTKTATELALSYLEKDEFRDAKKITVSLVGIASRDEYGNRDFRSLRKYAVVKLRRGDKGLPELVTARVAFDPPTESAVYQASAARSSKSESVIPASNYQDKPPEPLAEVVNPWPKELSEEILFDEMDLYDHPQHAGDRYPPFAPERVRRNQCDYYLVSDATRAAPGSIGPRFGEIVLRGEYGSLLYLPRAIKHKGAVAIAFSYRKSHPKARGFVSIYTSASRRAILHEGEHSAFPRYEDANWHRVVIPLSAFTVQSVKRTSSSVPPPAPAWEYLGLHEVDPGEVFALELGLYGGETGATLEFDRVSLVWPKQPSNLLVGHVVPPKAGVKIHVGAPDEQLEQVTDSQGKFAAELPGHWRRYEVFAEHNKIDYQPAQGRYFDRGTYLTPIRLELNQDEPVKLRARKGSVEYFWAADGRGAYYPSRVHHLHSGNVQRPPEYFTELATNDLGFFDRDHRVANPSNAYRIVLTGECYTEGSQIDSQERITAHLEAIQRFRHSRPVEIIGLIHPAMAFTQAWPAIEKVGLKFRPNLILINIVSPDALASMHVEYDAARWGYNPLHPRSTAFEFDSKTGALQCIPYDPSWNLFVGKGPRPQKIDYATEFGGVNWNKDLFRADASTRPRFLQHTVELLAATLKHFNREASKVGAKVALLNTTYALPRKWQENGVQYDTQAFHALLTEAATKGGTFVVDGGQILSRRSFGRTPPRGGSSHLWEHDGHWSPFGHRLAAEGSARELERLGILGDSPAIEGKSSGKK